MIILNAILLDKKDLPNKFSEVKVNKCPKCDKIKNSIFCGDCGTKIEPILCRKSNIDVYDFMEEYFENSNFLNYGEYNQYIYIGVYNDSLEFERGMILVDEIKQLFVSNLEDDKDIKIVIDKLKELNIPYKKDIILLDEY